MGLSVAEGRQHIAADLLAVDGHLLHAAADMVGIFDLDVIHRSAEAAADPVAVPGVRHAGINLQAVPVGLDAQDVKLSGQGFQSTHVNSKTGLSFPG